MSRARGVKEKEGWIDGAVGKEATERRWGVPVLDRQRSGTREEPKIGKEEEKS